MSMWLAPKLIQAAELVDVGVTSSFAPPGPNLLLNKGSNEADAWQESHSTVEQSDSGILVSSSEINYSAILSIDPVELDMARGQTYIVTVWVRASVKSPDGQIHMYVRENGSREGESHEHYILSYVWRPIVVEHTITRPDLESLSLHLARQGSVAGEEAFTFRDVQLILNPLASP